MGSSVFITVRVPILTEANVKREQSVKGVYGGILGTTRQPGSGRVGKDFQSMVQAVDLCSELNKTDCVGYLQECISGTLELVHHKN